MLDSRITEHAKIVVDYSCEVKKGDDCVIVTNSYEGLPLVREIAAEIGKNGAFLTVMLSDDSINRAYIMNADEGTLEILPKQRKIFYENLDVYFRIVATTNTQELMDVPPVKMKANLRSSGELLGIMMKKRWNVTLHPTMALAQEARMSYESYCDFVYRATLRNWEQLGKEMQVLADKMRKSKKVRLIGKDTDLGFSIEGRKPIVDDGKKNLPGGEVFTSPVDESVNGKVYFDLPLNYLGRELRGVRLTYKNGRVIEHSAEVGASLLKELFLTDDGANRLGELGIGMNRGINAPTRSTLFDEKMGDTIHMAVGQSFEEAGGTNSSRIHIDMIKSMKDEGSILFDDEPIYKDGKFVWE
jgi:aminopeptidase